MQSLDPILTVHEMVMFHSYRKPLACEDALSDTVESCINWHACQTLSQIVQHNYLNLFDVSYRLHLIEIQEHTSSFFWITVKTNMFLTDNSIKIKNIFKKYGQNNEKIYYLHALYIHRWLKKYMKKIMIRIKYNLIKLRSNKNSYIKIYLTFFYFKKYIFRLAYSTSIVMQ